MEKVIIMPKLNFEGVQPFMCAWCGEACYTQRRNVLTGNLLTIHADCLDTYYETEYTLYEAFKD